jgi:mannose-6-phosphate isomerase-like protein (cupin superfamily)
MIDHILRGLDRGGTMPKTLIRRENAPTFDLAGTRVTAYASPSRGSAGVAAWRLVLDPGAESPLHELTGDEALVALAGEAQVELGGEEFRLTAGDGLSVPPRTPFRIRNAGTMPFEAVACMAAGAQARVGDGEPFSPPWAV